MLDSKASIGALKEKFVYAKVWNQWVNKLATDFCLSVVPNFSKKIQGSLMGLLMHQNNQYVIQGNSGH